jgi:diaminohydroxyphosphoribosylaminopyrimidine deaminase/5-amino-6-(5-phosphoribosylamino)uracil reductase
VGIEVKSGFLVAEALRLNWRFLVAQTHHRPAVTLKWAMSLDGKIATSKGESQWISSPAGRRWGLAEREEHDAILVGSGTALDDDPSLNRRLDLACGANTRVVMDRRLRLLPTARLLDIPGPVLVYTESSSQLRRQELQERGALCIVLPRVEPATVLADLWDRGIQSILVEGGAGIHAAFAAAGLYDRVAVDLAPRLIAGEAAPGPLGGPGFSPLAEAPRLSDLRLRRRGEDVIVEGFREQCLADLYTSVAG